MSKIAWIIAKILKRITSPPALRECKIDKTSRVCPGCELTSVKMGRYSYIGSYAFAVNTEIGSFCSVADRCRIGGAEHPMDAFSTSPVFYGGKNILRRNFSNWKLPRTVQTVIENDVWIGANCCIKAGVTIHTGAVVGMGSVVTHDIPPYEVWAGNPARMIKKRFDSEISERLLASKWWLLPDDELLLVADSFCNPIEFLDKLNEKD